MKSMMGGQFSASTWISILLTNLCHRVDGFDKHCTGLRIYSCYMGNGSHHRVSLQRFQP